MSPSSFGFALGYSYLWLFSLIRTFCAFCLLIRNFGCAQLIRTFGSDRTVTDEREKPRNWFPSLLGFAEVTFARKNKEKQAFLWFFAHLIVPLHP